MNVAYLAGVRKVVAEALTRIPPLEPEWSLDQQTFQFFLTQVPGLQVDLFATAGNHQLPLYVAPKIDHQAVGVDALSMNWNLRERIYIFPPRIS